MPARRITLWRFLPAHGPAEGGGYLWVRMAGNAVVRRGGMRVESGVVPREELVVDKEPKS